MIRFIIKRKTCGGWPNAHSETFETFDVDVPALQKALIGGGIGPSDYDIRELVGVEVLPTTSKE